MQVAGTNGKGSICSFLGSILQEAGISTGIYRSPHLVSWCERLSLDGQWVEGPALRQALGQWQQAGQRFELTPFELLTAASFSLMAERPISLAVLEVGLGGRLDATTCHPDRRLIGVASIGWDHCEHLGSSLEAITTEKAGVFHPGARAFSAPQLPQVAAVLQQQAELRGCDLHWVEPLPADQPLGLAGEWQRSNGAVAMAMAEALLQQGWPLDPATMQRGLERARWPGRLQRLNWRGRQLLVDGAHNPPAAAALRAELGQIDPGDGRHWLLGIQRHKDGPAIVKALLGSHDRAWILQIPDHQCWTAEQLQQALPQLGDQLQAATSPELGLDQLIASPQLGVVCGSLHLLGALWPLLHSPDSSGPTLEASASGR